MFKRGLVVLVLLTAATARADEFTWVNVNVFPDDLETSEDAWTAARAEDDDFISYRCAAEDFVLTSRTRITQIGFYSVDFEAEILGGDWYLYEVGGDGAPGALIAGGHTLPLAHEDSGIVNSNFGVVYRNTMDIDVTLEPGRYFAALRSLITLSNGGGKHSLLTTRWANHESRAYWNFDVFRDGTVGGEWVTMDVFNLQPDNEWAFYLSGETVDAPCDGGEKLKARCRERACGNYVKGILKNAIPNTDAIFRLDGGDVQTRTTNANGKAVAKWCPAGSGSHEVTVDGCDLSAGASCP
ncbi:MAG: hypothetical protein BroJett003_03600 [Planctomycetota bacterium]|nr:MAG: hypothetical protein BroJett003_03600 [Planctomycetota bacterium]